MPWKDKAIEKIKRKEYRIRKQKEILEKVKKYYFEHIQERAEYNKKYRENNKEKLSKQTKNYYLKNRKTILKKQEIYNLNHKVEKIFYDKKYNILNKDKILNRAKNYIRIKRQTNLNFRILCNLRTRLWSALKGRTKSKRTIELLGCSVEFLKNYLESKFTEGMNWNNYGKWEVDHIKPCCKFDLTDPKQQEQCFHWSNLQPLWEKENIIKNGVYNATSVALCKLRTT